MQYFLYSAILFQKNVKAEDTHFVVAIDVGSAFSSYAYAVKVALFLCYRSKQTQTLIRWYVLSRKPLRTTPCLTITYCYNFISFEILMSRLVGNKVKTVIFYRKVTIVVLCGISKVASFYRIKNTQTEQKWMLLDSFPGITSQIGLHLS